MKPLTESTFAFYMLGATVAAMITRRLGGDPLIAMAAYWAGCFITEVVLSLMRKR